MLIPFIRNTVVNLFLFLFNLLCAPFSRLSRHRLSQTYNILVYPFYGNRYVDLSTLLKNDELSVGFAPVKSLEHNTTAFELLSICSILKDNNCNTIFEIGTFDGRTTRAMAMNLRDETGQVYTLNLPPNTLETTLPTDVIDINLASKVVSGHRFKNTPEEKFIKQLWGDSAQFDFSPFLYSVDLVFIDGAHSADYVKKDTENALKLIKPEGGIIIWHDSHLYGVVKYLLPWIKDNDLPIYFIKNTSIAVAGVRGGIVFDLQQLNKDNN